MKIPHASLHRPAVASNTIPAELDKHRRLVEKSNAFKAGRPRAQRHTKAMPKASSSENSARWALFFITLLALQHAAHAREEISARSSNMPEGKLPHAPKNETGVELTSDLQDEPGPNLVETRRGKCAEPPYLADTILAMPTRKEIGREILRNEGLDPEKNYTFTDLQPAFVGGVAPSGDKPLIDLYMEYKTFTFPFITRIHPNALDKLPPLDKSFDEAFYEYFSEASGRFSYECLQKLSKHGIEENDKADVIRVHIKHTRARYMGSPMFSFRNSNRGYILRVHKKHGPQYFAVSPKHCDSIIVLGNKHEERQRWMTSHLNLFFDIDSIEKRVGSSDYTHHDPRFIAPKLTNVTVHDAVVRSNAEIFEDTLRRFKPYAYQATSLQEKIRFLDGLVVPFYDAIIAAQQGNYKEAALEAVMDLYADLLGYAAARGTKALTNAAASKSATSAILRTGSKAAVEGKAIKKSGRMAKFAEIRGKSIKRLSSSNKSFDDITSNTGNNLYSDSSSAFVSNSGSSSMVDLATTALKKAKGEEEIAKINQLVEGIKELDKYRLSPKEGCEAVLESLTSRLSEAGYDTKIRGMYLWSNAYNDMPKNHFVVVASKDGMDYVVDLTAEQFSEFDFTRPIIATEDAWKAKYREATQRTLIKYKDFKSIPRATSEFGTLFPVRPEAVITKSKILVEPSWYRKIADPGEASETFISAGRYMKTPSRHRPMLAPLRTYLARHQTPDAAKQA